MPTRVADVFYLLIGDGAVAAFLLGSLGPWWHVLAVCGPSQRTERWSGLYSKAS